MKHHPLALTRLALSIGALLLAGCNDNDSTPKPTQPTLGHRTAALIEQDGLQFKDLDGNGTLTPYEDWRLGAAERARDLVGRLTLAQKAGLMMHGTLVLDAEGRVNLDAMDKMLRSDGVNTFITRMAGDPAAIAEDNNTLQALLEGVGLGIPMTVSTDPRNHFTHDPKATSIGAGAFSQWPETLGLAAIGDAALVQRFGDIARQEYRAVGIHEALSPQADLATEPRWGRINGTFGEDNQLAKSLVKAYIEGFQQGSDGIGKESVITVVKHFAGAGPQKDGLDAHNPWGKEQVYPGGQFAYHLVPFEGAFEAKVAAVMPYYALPEGLTYEGQTIEEVGFGFNRQILTDLLRGHFGFSGVVLSDWGIVNDCPTRCEEGLSQAEVDAGVSPWTVPFGMSWGVEKLSKAERYAKAIDAGVNQFGGVEDPAPLLAAVQAGLVTEAAVTSSAERILEQKFELGLFENPYVDVQAAVTLVGNDAFQKEAQAAQSAAHVLLKNEGALLPLKADGKRVYLYNVNAEVARANGYTVVTSLAEADLAIARVNTPNEQDPRFPFGMVHFGQLGFASQAEVVQETAHEGVYQGADDLAAIQAIEQAGVPLVLSIYLDRPAILTEVAPAAKVLLANFGALDQALFDVMSGTQKARGKLPFELPSSWQAVLNQSPDVAKDSLNPLYPYGAGLAY
ncbi:glycoside hydrolase family 3 protein [Aeromonas taiwanensis]|uniref:beta-glucosidase n=1 Tax=Aeromonas taiwanensis TaxID=633417 RepID=A0A5F0KAV5_9GAMM|nr:glycoside hydrolase family 3 N-terminal domain-containing protein [Aeromonas taiwanensis]TFF75801.1 glycoside hydrolase family 3 protein [Aeromonas taiwanensis]TFF76816.1 glycoside hydrolase family 3 protein [Aeromonas taiwanensis]TFF80263.1 glycoside hydrolase family 3 protein [Aeromonas taiwanensis]